MVKGIKKLRLRSWDDALLCLSHALVNQVSLSLSLSLYLTLSLSLSLSLSRARARTHTHTFVDALECHSNAKPNP